MIRILQLPRNPDNVNDIFTLESDMNKLEKKGYRVVGITERLVFMEMVSYQPVMRKVDSEGYTQTDS